MPAMVPQRQRSLTLMRSERGLFISASHFGGSIHIWRAHVGSKDSSGVLVKEKPVRVHCWTVFERKLEINSVTSARLDQDIPEGWPDTPDFNRVRTRITKITLM